MKYLKIRIEVGTSDSTFDIYYDSISSGTRALLYDTGLPAIGLTNEALEFGEGVTVSVPDNATSIILSSDPNAFCTENPNVNEATYTIPIGCMSYTISAPAGIFNYFYTDCDCNPVTATIDATYGYTEETFCALQDSVSAGVLTVVDNGYCPPPFYQWRTDFLPGGFTPNTSEMICGLSEGSESFLYTQFSPLDGAMQLYTDSGLTTTYSGSISPVNGQLIWRPIFELLTPDGPTAFAIQPDESGLVGNIVTCDSTPTPTPTSTPTPTPTTSLLSWSFTRDSGTGTYNLYINNVNVEARSSTSNGFITVNVGDEIYVNTFAGSCAGGTSNANLAVTGIIIEGACQTSSVSLTTGTYTVTSANIGQTIVLSTLAQCLNECL
jgi:hypothetical protein